jgi:hypothetical protein
MANAKVSESARGEHNLIASALRTFEAEAGGVAALVAALHDGLAQPFIAAVELVADAKAG